MSLVCSASSGVDWIVMLVQEFSRYVANGSMIRSSPWMHPYSIGNPFCSHRLLLNEEVDIIGIDESAKVFLQDEPIIVPFMLIH